MKLLTVMAATAAAAAVAAALTTPAGADRSSGGEATKIATCLHAHGATDAPSGTDALALKRWLATHAGNAAVAACQPDAAAPAKLMSCLRAHGLNPPDNLFQLKPWMARQAGSAAGKATLNACGVNFGPPTRVATGEKDVAGCLRSHFAGVPAGTDVLALKTWVRDHSRDPQVMKALEVCGGGGPPKPTDCGGGAPAKQPDSASRPKATPGS